jgi:general secretion pathway protein D
MKNRNITDFLSRVIVMTLLLGTISHPVFSQRNMPVREYTNPDELIVMGSATTFNQAFMIMGTFSRTFQNKVLLDRSGKSGTIGFEIPSMHWRQALDFIANAHDLVINEQADFIEITPVPVRSGPTTAASSQGSSTIQPVVLASLDSREIEISAIFFEGNRRELREIGIDWTAINNNAVSLANFGTNTVSLDIFQAEMATQQVGDWQISAFMSTLELNNLGEILASPTIKVMDGKQGDIQVGQDISIKQRDFAGNVTDAFVQTGTILTVTPTIINDRDTSFIFLNLTAQRSTGQPDPVSTIINKQQATTQVLLYSGESTVIAGLYETQETTIRRGIPFLKDLPPWFFGLRYLFGYNSTDIQEKELVIVLKAEIVPSLRERFEMERRSREQILQDGRRNVIINLPENQN